MDIPLAPEIEAVVLRKVALGEYRSVVELVEEALFLLVERDWAASQAALNRVDFADLDPGHSDVGGDPP